MSRIRHGVIWTLLALAGTGDLKAQIIPLFLQSDTLGGERFSLLVEGGTGFRSTAITSEFALLLLRGGFVGDAYKDHVQQQLGDNNRFGLMAEGGVRFYLPVGHMLGSDRLGVVGGLRYFDQSAGTFASDAFTLAFYGNAAPSGSLPSTGPSAHALDLGGTSVTAQGFLVMDAGLYHKDKGWQRGLSVYLGRSLTTLQMNQAVFSTAYNGMMAERLSFDGDASFSQSETSFSSGWGLGIWGSYTWQFKHAKGWHSLLTAGFRDLGFMQWGPQSTRDTTASIAFEGYSTASVSEVNALFGGLRNVIDSLLPVETRGVHDIRPLPATFYAQWRALLPGGWIGTAQAAYRMHSDAMPEGRVELARRFGHVQAALSAAAGGWGGFRPGASIGWQGGPQWTLMLVSYDLSGWLSARAKGMHAGMQWVWIPGNKP